MANAKEINILNNLKDRARTFWNAACVEAGIPVSSQFVVFSPDNQAAQEYNTIMGELFAAQKRIRKNVARRAQHAAYTSCGLVRVRGNLGGTYYE